MDHPANTFGYTPANPESGREAVFVPEPQDSADQGEDEVQEELVQGRARRTEPGEFPPDYWTR
ncbi:hypothetical protein GCM10018780_82170 [Streptomyces lanatus]|nr:hypothetical protein GCM10018780_82170 [Streptomyces lanatus]